MNRVIFRLCILSCFIPAMLQSSGSNINIELIRYINQKNPAGVLQCLKKSADVNFLWNDKTPLMFAVNKLRLESIPPKEWKKKGLMAAGLLAGSGLIIGAGWMLVRPEKNWKNIIQDLKMLEKQGLLYTINTHGQGLLVRVGIGMLLGGTAICTTSLGIKFLKDTVENFMLISKEIDQMIIIEILINHPDSHVDMSVNGVTAIDMIERMIAEEKDLLIKNKLETIADLIQKRIIKDQENAAERQVVA